MAGGVQSHRGYSWFDEYVEEDAGAEDYGKLLSEVGDGVLEGGELFVSRGGVV